jgi:hypothetical protein
MTPALAKLLARLIEADRNYRETNLDCNRWVEVGLICGINPRTAKVLDDAGLVEGRGNDTRYEIALRKDFDESILVR